ncbi:MAG: CPBP family intramembrane metalloprotease [Candidatus Peribacteraceae bacterium]|nr:CPBP family intramembrane metalloprotease [Candidatus Peribacteraceae bacterium]
MNAKRTAAGILLLAALPFLVKIAALGTTGYALQSLYKLAQLGIPVTWRLKKKRGMHVLWPFDEPRPALLGWMTGALLGCALALMGIIAIQIGTGFGLVDPVSIRAGFDQRFTVHAPLAVAIVLFLSTLNAALEELHFRAWLDRELSALCGNAAGIGISALAFGGMHILIFWGMPWFSLQAILMIAGALALAGAVWSALARMRGGIHLAFFSHAVTDVLLLTWGLFWLGYM